MNINKVIVAGRLGKDPEAKSLTGGSTVANFSIATNQFWTDKTSNKKMESTEWVNCVCFGKTAENIAKFFKKGKEIYVEGRLQTRSWDGKDGKKNYKTEVLVDSFQFVGYDNDSAKPKETEQDEPPIIEEEEGAINSKDLPF